MKTFLQSIFILFFVTIANAQTTTNYLADFQNNNSYNNFITPNVSGGNGTWPPGENTSGPQYSQMWSRILYTGWPTNTGSQDPSARNQGGSKDNQEYDEWRVSPSNNGLVFNAENVPGIYFPQFPWQSGMIISNPNLSFSYGYFQATIFVPKNPGFNRAMAIYSANVFAGWPWEIDPFQFIGLNQDNKASNSDFFLDATNNNGTQTTYKWISKTPCTGWHNIGADIEASTITFYFDNKPMWTTTTPANLASDPNMIVQIGQAVGAPDSWETAPASSITETSMSVTKFEWTPSASFTAGSPPFLPLP